MQIVVLNNKNNVMPRFPLFHSEFETPSTMGLGIRRDQVYFG
jgi:hypothetical protein